MPDSKSRWYEKSEVSNLSRFDVSRSMEHCTVITFDGIPGFMWYDHFGKRHNEGLNWPKMNVIRDATVELLYDSETGEHSAGWKQQKEEDVCE